MNAYCADRLPVAPPPPRSGVLDVPQVRLRAPSVVADGSRRPSDRSRRRSSRRTLPLALFVWLLGSAAPAWAQVSLCVHVQAAAEDEAGLRALVLDEVAHHPTHRVVDEAGEDPCAAHLIVELFRVEEGRFLTARAAGAVPLRYPVPDAEALDGRVREAVARVLGTDPVLLAEDVTRLSAFQRATRGILQQGHTRWRIELVQALTRSQPNPSFTSGVGFGVSRGSGHWLAGVRAYVTGTPQGPSGEQRVVRTLSGLDAGLTWEASARGTASFYAHAGLGLQFLDVVATPGPTTLGADHLLQVGAVFQSRVGVRFLRHTDADVDLFVAGYVPLYLAHDEDNPVYGEGGLYTPSLQVGLGVGF